MAVWAEADVEADDVGLLEELVEGDELDADSLCALGGWVECPSDAVHAECVCDACDFASDVACADDADGLALEGEVLDECPSSCFEFGGLECGAFGGGEHESDDVFGDDGGSASGLVADDDAELFGGVDVDHVNADGAGCDHAEVWECAEGVCRPFDCAACVDDDVCAACAFELFVHVCRAVEVEGDVAVGLEAVEMGGSLYLGRVVAGYDEFQAWVGHGEVSRLGGHCGGVSLRGAVGECLEDVWPVGGAALSVAGAVGDDAVCVDGDFGGLAGYPEVSQHVVDREGKNARVSARVLVVCEFAE